MIASKKHPLEIFREHDKNLHEGAKRSLKSRFSKVKSRIGQPDRAETDIPYSRPDARENESSPGDFKVTLTLNQILLSSLCVIVLVILGYFIGFSRGSSQSSQASLSHANPNPTLLKDPTRAEGNVVEEAPRPRRTPASSETPGRTPSEGPRYGILIASYNRDKEDVLDRTRAVMVDRGYEIFKYFYEGNRKFGLIIGSYDRQNHPDLVRLLERIRAIDDFPGSGGRPFQTAFVVKHPNFSN